MIVEFSTANFWSFKEMQSLRMQAAKIVSKYPKVDQENLFQIDNKLSLLKSKAVYGANASGKSNLIRAFDAMMHIMQECLRDMETLDKYITPFYLDETKLKEPGYFQLVFTLNNTLFRYGFEASKNEIISEWLFGKKLNSKRLVKERYYFTREGMKVTVNDEVFKEGKQFAGKKKGTTPLYRENSLFLSVVAAWNGKLSKKIVEHFQRDYAILSGLDDLSSWNVALNSMADPAFLQKTTGLLQAIDPTIERLEKIDIDADSALVSKEEKRLANELKKSGGKFGRVVVFRKQKGRKKKEVPLGMFAQEAEGTKKMFSLSPFIFSALETGKTLLVDEFDARMHPNLTRKIVELFHSPQTNPNNAQLIFITHDTNLLNAKLLRRDQICFVQKDKDGASELYSLVEFKGVRNDASFEKDYLLGKYRAVPTNLGVIDVIAQSSD